MANQTKPIANITVTKGNTIPNPNKDSTLLPPTKVSFAMNKSGGCTASVTVLIDAINTEPPTLNVDTDNNTNFYVQYDNKEETPIDVTEWTLSAENYLGGLQAGQQVTVYLQDIDPKTSRGTSTSVTPPPTM